MNCKYYTFCKNNTLIKYDLCQECLQYIYPKSPKFTQQSCNLCGEINTCLRMNISLDNCKHIICSKCISSQNYIMLSCPICENINTKQMYLYFFVALCILIKLIPYTIWIILWALCVYSAKEIMYLLYY